MLSFSVRIYVEKGLVRVTKVVEQKYLQRQATREKPHIGNPTGNWKTDQMIDIEEEKAKEDSVYLMYN